MQRQFPSRVLVVRLGAIGDVVNALVFANALKAVDPGVHIGWAAHELVVPLLEGHPAVDRVHVWPRSSGLRGGFALAKELRAERYELTVDLQRILKSAVLARLARTPRILGFDRGRTKEAAWLLSTERIAPGSADEHMVDRYLAFARHLGAPAARPTWNLQRDPAAARSMEERFGDARPILVNLGASKPANRWSEAGFVELVRVLAERSSVPVVLTGGPDDRAAFAGVLDALAGRAGVRDLVGRTSLLGLAELARRSACMITCDTGPMHIAVAVGLRVVALFGPANSARTGPYGAGHAIVRPPAGSLDTADIRASDVLAALDA